MKKIIYTMLIILIAVIIFSKNNQNNYIIPNDAIRFRIIANSDKDIDQQTKLLIKKDLEKNFLPLVENSQSKEETISIINNNHDIIKNTIDKYNIMYSINYGQNYFPEKEYLGSTYKAGNYESLVISLGEAKGQNWWCVMYPPLCLLDTKEQNENIEYTSFIKEMFKKLTS